MPSWMRIGKKGNEMKNKKTGSGREAKHKKAPSLDDVTPMHPDDYPGKHMKERLDAHRDMLDEIEERGHPTGLPEGGWS